jgi:hypothetical protein
MRDIDDFIIFLGYILLSHNRLGSKINISVARTKRDKFCKKNHISYLKLRTWLK